MIRIVKSLLVLTVGANALISALQNIANLDEARGALAYVISGAGHETYPHTLFFYSSNRTLAWVGLAFVLAGEFAVAVFGIKGAWDLFVARNGTTTQFAAAKIAGLYAGALALLTWFGLFLAIGANFFQMWQTPMGSNSQDHAFQFASISVLTILFIYVTPD
jgi:predicted small integral membrane protein